tara:strand:+ start:5264 stop:5476 length:213 start_codon:yes stop_codon:yes gene_type:complete
MVKFTENDRKQWQSFRLSEPNYITRVQFHMVCHLHSQYYKHKYYEPCTCNPKKINKLIKDLNIIWDNGIK